MPIKDYYVVLGIARTETTAGIRAAYRALAKRCHPDHVGAEATPDFQAINEAYQVLSDPAQRRLHNHDLQEAEARSAPRTPPRRTADALVPEQGFDLSILSDPAGVWPSFEALHDRFFRNFTGAGVPKAERIEGLDMDLILTVEEARRGLVLQVRVPASRDCPTCGGIGWQWAFPCLDCEGRGTVEHEETVPVHIPAGIRTGTVVDFPLTELGIRNLAVRFHVSVTGARDPITIA
jgi:molecular chaperone DnaJ